MHLPQYIYPKEFQKPKSESLFHDLLFHRFIKSQLLNFPNFLTWPVA